MDALHSCLLLLAVTTPAANVQTSNFVVSAPTTEFAQQVGEAAEYYRRELAIQWLGQELPRWAQRCPIAVKVGDYGASGATTFNFDRGEVFGWHMNVTGTAERILDSVLPHEVNHTIFASYFRQPLPRWADEGAASLIEHSSERLRLKRIHEQVMRTTRKIPLRELLPMREYPTETQQVLTMYAEGYSLADLLIQQSSKPEYLRFLGIALRSGWNTALKTCYGYNSVEDLEHDLDRWILAGSPDLSSPAGEQLALLGHRPAPPTIRAQSDDRLPIQLGPAADWPSPRPFAINSDAPGDLGDHARDVARTREGRNNLQPPVLSSTASDPQQRMSRSRLQAPSLVVTSGRSR